MGRPEKEGRCKRHPTHKQSSGVCPFCLRDKLTSFSRSSSSSTSYYAASSTDSSSAYSSYDSELSSLTASPPREILRKSKSLALPEEAEGKRKKESGRRLARFWGQLMMAGGGRRKAKKESLSHSKTVKEKASSKWTIF